LKPGFHFIGSRVETKRFEAMGKLHSQLVQPHHSREERHDGSRPRVSVQRQRPHLGYVRAEVYAVQVEFNLKLQILSEKLSLTLS
jgi:hypothetical protein